MTSNLSTNCLFESFELPSALEGYIFITVNILSCILATFGNGIILYIIYKKEHLWNTSNFLLCSLAFADLLVGIVAHPLKAAYYGLNFWTYTSRNWFTKLNEFLGAQLLVATSFNLCAVSLDRFLAVKWPLKYPQIATSTNASRVIKLIWVSSILLGVPMLIFTDGVQACIYWLFLSILTLCASMIVILYCYTVIVKIAKEQERSLGNDGCLQVLNSRKAVKTFTIIITVFFLCFTPNGICSILCAIPFEKCPEIVQVIVNNWEWYIFLVTSSSFINPLIYGMRSKNLRTAFRKLIAKNNKTDTHNTS